jgi:hypothetical protein
MCDNRTSFSHSKFTLGMQEQNVCWLFCQLTLPLFEEWKEFYHMAKVDHRFPVSHPVLVSESVEQWTRGPFLPPHPPAGAFLYWLIPFAIHLRNNRNPSRTETEQLSEDPRVFRFPVLRQTQRRK